MQAGFVLPTTVLVLLVVGLTVTALLFRSFSRTSQVIGQREQQKIYNAATPTIDRAKAKLENLFGDGNLPAGVPPEKFLVGKMSELDVPDDNKVYSLPGETRLDLNGDGTLDNAWSYQDSTGNTVVYSILMKTQGQDSGNNEVTYTDENSDKAAAMVVRSGPVNTAQLTPACQIQNNQGDAAVENGWFRDASSSAFLRKNFQINAVVLNTNSNAPTKAVATLELQQERQVDRGNKWGVWFRNDLEIFPGPSFRWNGAMHAEGSLFLGSNEDAADGTSRFRNYLISSPSSCIYGINGIEPSEISINQQVNKDQQVTFQGQIVSGRINNNSFQEYSSTIDRAPDLKTQLQSSTDSVKDTNLLPIQIALDPLAIFTENKSRSRNANDPTNTTIRNTADWDNSNPLATGDTQRVFNKQVPIPYLDDTYRADNLYGPKLPPDGLPTNGKKAGNLVETTDVNVKGEPLYSKLVSNDPPADNPELLGLDGYWERRARLTGLRVIVGQRLELGNPLSVPDPVAFPSTFTRQHEALQRRALRDNLAAVQATAIYHYENDPNNLDSPIACVATTAHPGTATTQRNSATFKTIMSGTTETLYSDFFTGRGTNGWEYNVPDAATFPNASMLRALRNLANFAGDPFGAFPARQDSTTVQAVPAVGQVTHPYPELTRYGNFSNLRRAIFNFDTNGGYSNLSIADKSYLQTAACSLGMLANTIKVLQDYDYGNASNKISLSSLDQVIKSIPATANTPELVITALTNANQAQLARAIYSKEQVELDRRNGLGLSSCSASDFGSTHTVGGAGAGLARLCPPAGPAGVKYQALYYIFPTTNHAEGRITDTYITSAIVNPITNPNLYQVISDTALESIRLKPKLDISIWALNTVNVTTNTDPLNTSTTYGTNTNVPNHRQESLIRYQPITGTSTVHRVPFKDTAPFNGREMMSVRVLNIDLDLLRRENVTDDSWLPASGLIYAFREDAVREDAIARPEIAAWNTYKNVWNDNPNNGPPVAQRMNASPNISPNSPKDPPLNADTGLSPKPIDYYADPDRRPYGFRLKNGSELSRTNANNTFGLSFISDNPVYIQGDFNLHRNSSNQRLEEFAQYLTLPDWNNFYTRSTLDPQFARAADRWRPSEIVADAVTILSNNFCDGSVEDGFTPKGTNDAPSNRNDIALAPHGCGTSNGMTSYLNQNRPNSNTFFPSGFTWQRETPELNSPIRISQNGAPFASGGTPYNNNNYRKFSEDKRRNEASETRVNAIIVSGLVPSRVQQSYGGLHNFPRFLEDWKNGGVSLHISGSFIQLNFSSYATGPFDQDAWESSQVELPKSTEDIKYYEPPARRWGYDVGLQYQPPGSVSRRFTTPSTTRSEFYKELSLDDPYISMLRCASNEDGEQVDPNLSCP